ncbi:hypothetical protein [Massilia sp. TWR1-2-2]|uniref:hypothetical protein n=1 Tax=Massilia sp. TWR1-2-2 TaxID=2804584 RepID=UPI003CED041F
MTTLRVFHRTTAIIVVIFVVAHLSNHLAALASLDAYQRLMDQLRLVYREPVIEVFLLACVSLQAATGLRLVWLRRKTRSGLIELLQAGSGAYLALFLWIHVAAVLMGRAVYGRDTNFHYAAAGLHVYPFAYFLRHITSSQSWRYLLIWAAPCPGTSVQRFACAFGSLAYSSASAC